MAKNRSAMKRAQLSEVRAKANASRKSAMKTAVKRFDEALAEGEQTKIQASFKAATRLVDKAGDRGIIHSNARDRKKAQLTRKLQATL